MRRYEAVVFDWDGTLVDSTGLISESILLAAADLEIVVPDRTRASHVIGLGLVQALAHVVPGLPPARVAEFTARYQAHYRRGEQQIRFFAGARELLAVLRSRPVRLAVATGKSHAGLQRALEQAGLQAWFETVRCADQTHPKPHPAMLQEIAEELELEPGALLMIGDTSHDLRMAAAAGVDAVAVTYGAHPRAELEALAPVAIFDSVAPLQAWLLERC